MKIVHISDVHVRLLKLHKNYRKSFSVFYEKVRAEAPDIIVFCGDLLHSKNNISPEMIDLATEFLRSVSQIAPLYLILGNHDCVISNLSRQNSITPLVEALNEPNIKFLKDSGVTDIGTNFNLCNFSIVDKDNWSNVVPEEGKVNICLYHGPLKGAYTDAGWAIEKSELNVDELEEKFDFGFFGDIHKANQILTKTGRFRYVGSLISQNFSEEEEKGFLVWDIESKEKYDCRFVVVENSSPFATISVMENGRLPENLNVPPNARIRLRVPDNLSFDAVRKIIDVTKIRFSADSVTFVTDKTFESKKKLVSSVYNENINLRDVAVQEKLIREYYDGQGINEEVLEQVIDLNRNYKALLEQDEDEVFRNIHWKVDWFEWNNLFNYGEGNKIDFSLLKGVVGIFGKSFLGKSSICDGLCYTIFNAITKNSRKNFNIVNQNKRKGSGKIQLDIDGSKYLIERVTEKYEKRLKGSTTDEAKTSVDFVKLVETGTENLNGTERNDTDKMIRQVFGNIDDFMLTAMATQFGSMSFIGEGSTRRKEILSKFLDLEIFERRFKLAKEEAAEIKSSLKKMENVEFEKNLFQIRTNMANNMKLVKKQVQEQEDIKSEIRLTVEHYDNLVQRLSALPRVSLNIGAIQDSQKRLLAAISLAEKENADLNVELLEKQNTIKKIEELLSGVFDIEVYRSSKQKAEGVRASIESLKQELSYCFRKEQDYKNKVGLLESVPCGSEYSGCKFIKDAYEAKECLLEEQKKIESLQEELRTQENLLEELDLKKINEYIEKYDRLCTKKNDFLIRISSIQVKIQQNMTSIVQNRQKLIKTEEEIQEYEKNRETIENYEKILAEKTSCEQKLKNNRASLAELEQKLVSLHKKTGSFEQQLEDLEEKRKELDSLRKRYAAYDYYAQAMHFDGISTTIIQQKLPLINDEISKILMTAAPFSVYLESVGNRLEIKIQHPGFPGRSIEMASGAEKSLAALAIRIAMIKICNLPAPNFLILDEPCTALDNNTLEGFMRLLDVLKEEFEFLILISHQDELKGCADIELVIDTVDKYAKVVAI